MRDWLPIRNPPSIHFESPTFLTLRAGGAYAVRNRSRTSRAFRFVPSRLKRRQSPAVGPVECRGGARGWDIPGDGGRNDLVLRRERAREPPSPYRACHHPAPLQSGVGARCGGPRHRAEGAGLPKLGLRLLPRPRARPGSPADASAVTAGRSAPGKSVAGRGLPGHRPRGSSLFPSRTSPRRDGPLPGARRRRRARERDLHRHCRNQGRARRAPSV